MTQPAFRQFAARKRIALVAHDHRKKDLIDWAFYNRIELARHELFATGTTGRLLSEALDRPVQMLQSGPLGGDLQIGARIAEGKIDVLIFFWDPMEAQPHDPDVRALLRIGVVWNIPIACDRATADFLLTSPLMLEPYEAILPDYSEYVGRKMG
jgi:methylglyoxal synthase